MLGLIGGSKTFIIKNQHSFKTKSGLKDAVIAMRLANLSSRRCATATPERTNATNTMAVGQISLQRTDGRTYRVTHERETDISREEVCHG